VFFDAFYYRLQKYYIRRLQAPSRSVRSQPVGGEGGRERETERESEREVSVEGKLFPKAGVESESPLAVHVCAELIIQCAAL
jgi:hypothetical protein